MTPKRLADLCAPDFIQKHRGEWRIGDMYYYPRQAETEGHNGIRFINAGYGEGYNKEPCCPDVAIWLPRAIDPFHPERGLWGMVDWERYYIGGDGSGQMNITEYTVTGDWNAKSWRTGYLEPTEALLRAIWRQEGL